MPMAVQKAPTPSTVTFSRFSVKTEKLLVILLGTFFIIIIIIIILV